MSPLLAGLIVNLMAASALFASIHRFFAKLDDALAPDKKVELWMWLSELKLSKFVDALPLRLINTFDAALGQEHFSWNSFARCTLFSFAISFMAISCSFLHYSLNLTSLSAGPALSQRPIETVFAAALGLPILFVVNAAVFCIPDYFSILKTRWLLRLGQHSRNVASKLFLLALEFITGYGIGFFSLYWGFLSVIRINGWLQDDQGIYFDDGYVLQIGTLDTHSSYMFGFLQRYSWFIWIMPALAGSLIAYWNWCDEPLILRENLSMR